MTNIIKKLTKKINLSNAAFEKLEKRDQRVAIARDVIAGLKVGKLQASHNTYIVLSEDRNNYINNITKDYNPDISFKETLKTVPVCNVCAKGAIFVCTVARKNKVKNVDVRVPNLVDGSVMSNLLGNLFSHSQLRLIETEFEGRDIEEENNNKNCVMNLSHRFDNAEDRMICIMRNIIRNRGTFRPDQEVWKD